MFTQYKRSKGISMFGFIMAMIVVVMAAVVAMKVVPMYIEFNSVKQAMNGVAGEQFDSTAAVRESLMKRFNINYVETVKREDITIAQKEGKYNVGVDYYVDKPLVGNLSLSAHFEYNVTTK